MPDTTDPQTADLPAEERAARHLAAKDHPHADWAQLTGQCRAAYLADARGVLAAAEPPAADRGAVYAEVIAHVEAMPGYPMLVLPEEILAELRRVADEAQHPDTQAPADACTLARRYADALAGSSHTDARTWSYALRWFSQLARGGGLARYARDSFGVKFGIEAPAEKPRPEPEAPKLPPMDPVHILGIEADGRQQPETRQACACGQDGCEYCGVDETDEEQQPETQAPDVDPVYDPRAWETYRRDAGCGCTAPAPVDCKTPHGTGAWLCVCHRLSGPPVKDTDPRGTFLTSEEEAIRRHFNEPNRCLSTDGIFRCSRPTGHLGDHRTGRTFWGRRADERPAVAAEPGKEN